MSAAYPRWPKLTAVNFAARAVCAAHRSNETLLPARGCRSPRPLPGGGPDRLQNINQARYPDEVRDDRPCELACNLERIAPVHGRGKPPCADGRETES